LSACAFAADHDVYGIAAAEADVRGLPGVRPGVRLRPGDYEEEVGVTRKSWPLNTSNLEQLTEVLPQLSGMKAEITVRVSIEELQRLNPQQLKAFLGGIATVVSAHAEIARTD
jgi:hypothetical protein